MTTTFIKFDPIFKRKVWGGDKLNTFLNYNSPDNTGEVWLISDRCTNQSTTRNGETLRSML